jgi:16S rRNA G966 N2-methylase RsmD
VIKENSEHTGFNDHVRILREDAIQAIKRMSRDDEQFDLIFCDPPYNLGWGERILAAIDETIILRETGTFIIEHAKHEKLPACLKRIESKRSESYGETIVTFYQTREV